MATGRQWCHASDQSQAADRPRRERTGIVEFSCRSVVIDRIRTGCLPVAARSGNRRPARRVMAAMSTVTPTCAEATFDAFAPHYDRFTAHHRYEAWIATLEALLREHGWEPGPVLDVACGTGKSTEPWLRRGLPVTACDVSEGMLARARERAAGATLFACDMRALEAVGEFALVACLDDAVNYLADADELCRALEGMAANVAREGRVLFDTNTLATY